MDEPSVLLPGSHASRQLEMTYLCGLIMMSDKERQMMRQWVQEGNCRVTFFEAQPRTSEFGLEEVITL